MGADAATTTSQVYTWEPSDAVLAARYGVPVERIVRFDTNTSPAAPVWLPEVLRRPFVPPLNEYPDSGYAELTDAVARYAGVSAEEVIVGAGADEILDLVAKALLPAGGTALVPAPTYGMYGVLSSQRSARVVTLGRRGPETGFELDPDGIQAALAEAHVVWLCAPNNPTGTEESPAAIERVLDAASAAPHRPVVVLDEAYHEFCPRPFLALRERYPRLLVVRTVSKAFGLAGARVGYGIAQRGMIERLERVRSPGSISTVSARLASEALSRPEDMRANADGIRAERERLAAALLAAKWRVLPSVTNFLLLAVGDAASAAATAGRLLAKGLVPRTFPEGHVLEGYLRITVRSPAENDRLLEVLE